MSILFTRDGSIVGGVKEWKKWKIIFLQPDSTVDIYEDEINAFYLEKIMQLTPRTEHIFKRQFFSILANFDKIGYFHQLLVSAQIYFSTHFHEWSTNYMYSACRLSNFVSTV